MCKKTLVFMYIADSFGFHGQRFNFSTQEKFIVKVGEEGDLVLTTEEYTNKLPHGFWGKNISEISLFVGANGAGKTTFMRLICQWICSLSEGNFPWEKGILVFREDNDLKYVAFEEENEMSVSTEIPKIEKQQLKDFFKNIYLVYYSNTMTELRIDGYDILRDYSIASKMKKANVKGHAMGEDIIANYKCYEFQQQIKVALKDEKFPIKYILLEIQEYSSEEICSFLLNHSNDIRTELKKLFESSSYSVDDNLRSENQFFKVKLLQALFVGIIVKLLKWGKRYKVNGRNEVEEALSIISISNIQIKRIMSQVNELKDFFKELFQNCIRAFKDSTFKEEYVRYWSGVEICINNMLDFFLKEENDKCFSSWVKEPVLTKSKKKTYVWKIDLKENKEILNRFWENYSQINSFLENVHVSWDASSGEKSWAGLFSDLKNDAQYKSNDNIWYLLDEPDNTFHPRWKRKLINRLIQELKKSCGKKQVWISTHSPIMLSDMPGQASIYLKTRENGAKEVVEKEKYTFGQNIYVLFDDAFFLKKGVIGKFASKKILKTLKGLEETEKILIKKRSKNLSSKEQKKISEKIDEYEENVRLVAEPAFALQMQHYIDICRQLLNQVRNRD